MINGVFQVEDAIFDGVADVVLRVGSGGGHLLIGTAFCKLLMLRQVKGEEDRWRKKGSCNQKNDTITTLYTKHPFRIFPAEMGNKKISDFS